MAIMHHSGMFVGGTLAVVAGLALGGPAQAAQEKVLYRFLGGADGSGPSTSLLVGPGGVLYGATYRGGVYGQGTVFKLVPLSAGATEWAEQVIYSFKGKTGPNGQAFEDGAAPQSNLVMDKSGRLYGTTFVGGTYNSGAAFRLTPPAAGQTVWTETVMYSGLNKFDDNVISASGPQGQIYLDSSNVLYGTMVYGGDNYAGGVFRIAPATYAPGTWTFMSLNSFRFDGIDGQGPVGITLGQDGSFYGATFRGGPFDEGGTLFRLLPPSAGQSQRVRQTIYDFATKDQVNSNGSSPESPPIADRSLNLYGTTYHGGGVKGVGVVYKLTAPGPGHTTWGESILYTFTQSRVDGSALSGSGPAGGLLENDGVLYGTTVGGGAALPQRARGTVFKLTPRNYGGSITPWNEVVLHAFTGPPDGAVPQASLVSGSLPDGTLALFGTTVQGGINKPNLLGNIGGFGTVFEIIP